MPHTPEHRPVWLDALPLVCRLTPREHEVFLLLAGGPSNQEIADSLVVTERTVRAHLTAIHAKLHLQGRLQACLVSLAFRTPELHRLSLATLSPT